MKILFISNHFSLPDQPGAPRPWKVASYLGSLGHEVTVITNQRHYFNEKIKVGGEGSGIGEYVNGIRIIGVNTTRGRRSTLAKRFLNYISFSLMSLIKGKDLEKHDAIIVGTPPLLVPIVGIILSRIHNARSILEIRDIYPETAIVLGKVKNKLLLFFWEIFENSLRNKYDHIVPVVPRIKKILLKKGFSDHKITTITNGFDEDSAAAAAELPDDLEKVFQDNRHKFKIVYGGGMGYAINIMTIIQAAEIIDNRADIIFLLFGEGEKKESYKQYIDRHNINNCLLFPAQPRNIIHSVFKMSDALIHSFINDDFFKCALPNKIFEYHASAKPIVFAGKGDTADLIRKAGSGIVVTPESPQEMADAILKLAEKPAHAEKMGSKGRAYIVNNYKREIVFKKWIDVLKH